VDSCPGTLGRRTSGTGIPSRTCTQFLPLLDLPLQGSVGGGCQPRAMDSTVAAPRTTAAVLEAFFSTHPMLRHPALAARARQVRLRLEDYLDTEAERWLTTGELEAVHEERRAVAAGLAGAEGVVA